MKKGYCEFKTTDGTKLWVRKDAVAAVEEIPSLKRVEGHVKVYTSGYRFAIDGTADEIFQRLSEPDSASQ